MSFDEITRCLELSDAHMAQAMESSGTAKELFFHLVSVARPNDGAPKILILLARMATSACTWLDGDLRLELLGDAQTSTINLTSELGAGMRERVFPALAVNVPLAEFARALELAPHVVLPLVTQSKAPDKLVLTARADSRMSLPPPSSRADAEVFARPTLPPSFDLEAFARDETGSAPINIDPKRVLDAVTNPRLHAPTISLQEVTRPTLPPNFDLESFARTETGEDLNEGALVERLGSLSRVPHLVVESADVPKLAMDRTAGFLLSQIDGVSSLDMILDVCGMPRVEALRILFRLVQQGIVELT